jgi:protein phosphatase
MREIWANLNCSKEGGMSFAPRSMPGIGGDIMKVFSAGKTDPGRTRSRNEDNYLILPGENLCVVADGMGGHEAGDLASRLAVESVSQFYQITSGGNNATWPHVAVGYGEFRVRRLASAVQFAHRSLVDAASACPGEAAKMGCTLAALHVVDSLALVAHVGDCRCYQWTEGALRRLTRDHSVVAELQERYELTSEEERRLMKYRHVVTRALGTGSADDVPVDVRVVVPKEGDLFLLCSDGLCGEVSDDEIAAVLGQVGDPETICDNLIAAANEKGGKDNITVVAVRFEDSGLLDCLSEEETTEDPCD